MGVLPELFNIGGEDPITGLLYDGVDPNTDEISYEAEEDTPSPKDKPHARDWTGGDGTHVVPAGTDSQSGALAGPMD